MGREKRSIHTRISKKRRSFRGKWETGKRSLKQMVAANREWADEYHLIAKTTANHTTHLYEHTGFIRDPI